MKNCLVCFKDIYNKVTLSSYFQYDDCICEECRNKMISLRTWSRLKELEIFSIYEYDRYMESLLFQFKEGKDIALKEIFFYKDISYIEKKFKGYTVVYMPSSDERTKQRGFFPLEEMLQKLSLPKCHYFEKSSGYKQSAQPYQRRKEIGNIIKVKDESMLLPRKILLVDDVCTSGETLLSAYRLLPKEDRIIKALVLCNNHSVELCDEKKFPFFNIIDILKKKTRSWF